MSNRLPKATQTDTNYMTLKKIAALTIAGSDPSGGAGLQADLKSFQQMGVYGMSALTLLTVQNTQGVTAVQMIDADFVRQQIDAVLEDIPPQAIKVGALGSSELVSTVATCLKSTTEKMDQQIPVVIDPVMVSKHGHSLVADDFVTNFSKNIIPLATVVTPNRFEAEKICGYSIQSPVEAEKAARTIVDMGARFALVKFGKVGDGYLVALAGDGASMQLTQAFVETKSTHGTGCVLSALITAKLAHLHEYRSNFSLEQVKEVVVSAMNLVANSLSSQVTFGKGIHPVETRSLRMA